MGSEPERQIPRGGRARCRLPRSWDRCDGFLPRAWALARDTLGACPHPQSGQVRSRPRSRKFTCGSIARSAATRPPHIPCWPIFQCASDRAVGDA
jgi:hypothetical protein